MSFILDALQKDQVAQQPEPLPAGMLPPPSPSPVKRWGLWLLGAALLVNAAVLAWYLLSQQPNNSSNSNATPSIPGAQRELSMGPTRAAGTNVPADPTSNNRSSNRSNNTPANRPNDATRVSNIPKRSPDRTPATAPIRASTQPSTQTSTQLSAGSSSTTAAATGAGRVLSPAQAAKLGIGDDLLDTPAQTADQPTRAQPEPAIKPKPSSQRAPDAITIAQLPTAARNSFPKLEFSTHIFADDPSMRAVVVNDKRLTEGEQLGELILRAVTEEGVVFGYRNHLVAVSVVELWAD